MSVEHALRGDREQVSQDTEAAAWQLGLEAGAKSALVAGLVLWLASSLLKKSRLFEASGSSRGCQARRPADGRCSSGARES
jgi:hypothetical protein